VVILEHGAFSRAFLAGLGAQLAEIGRKLRFGRHETGRLFAEACAFHQRADAGCPGLHVRFTQAKFFALAARLRAPVARVDAFLIFIGLICYYAQN